MMVKLLAYTPFFWLIFSLFNVHGSYAFQEVEKNEDCSRFIAQAYQSFSMARIYWHHKMQKEAEEMLREAVILDSCSPSLQSEAADLFLKMGKEEEADHFSMKALEMDPEDLMAIKIQALLKGMQALMLRDEDRLAESLAYGQKAFEKDAKDPRIYSLLAKLHFEKGNLEESAEILGKYLLMFQGSLEPIFLVTDLIKESEESASGEKFLSALISQENMNPRLILLIGNVLENSGYLSTAQQLYHQASLYFQDADLTVKDALASYEMGYYEESVKALERLEASVREESTFLRMLASAQRKMGRIKSAKKNYETLFQRHPQDSSLTAEIGEFYQSIGDFKNAVKHFKLALQFQPDTDSSATGLSSKLSLALRTAMLLILKGDMDEASRLLSKSRKYGGEEDIRYYVLASRVEENKSIKKALKIIQKAKKKFPTHTSLLIREAELYLSSDKEKAKDLLKKVLEMSLYSKDEYLYISKTLRDAEQFEMAEELLQEAMTLYPDSDIFLEMGALMERWKRYQEAETFLKDSIKSEPHNAIALNYLGYMLAEQSDRYEEALSYIQRALELDHYNGAYLDSLGFTYLKLGKLELAEKNILAAAEIYPFDPEIKEHLGDLYYALGDVDKAIAEWQSALHLNINTPDRIKSKIDRAQSLNPPYED